MSLDDLDLPFARSLFPQTCWDWAFFENAGGSYVPESVIDRTAAYMRGSQVQPGAPYPSSALAAERMAEGQRLTAEMINAEPRELIIGPSTTYNLYTLSHALRPLWREGDEIIVTNLDHEANIGVWRRLAQTGIRVREWPANPDTHELEAETLRGLLSERTRLVCVTHCSNITGGINDVRAFADIVHGAGAQILVDGVAYAAHAPIDVKALGADYYAFSLYKFYGPHLGALWGKAEHLLAAKSQMHYFTGEDNIPLKLNPGGPNHEFTAALAGVTDYFEALAAHHLNPLPNDFRARTAGVFDLFQKQEHALGGRFLDFAAQAKGLTLYGRAQQNKTRAPTFSFTIEGYSSQSAARALEADKVAVRHGDFYARRIVETFGLDPQDGVIRASMVHYNTLEEVDRLINGLARLTG